MGSDPAFAALVTSGRIGGIAAVRCAAPELTEGGTKPTYAVAANAYAENHRTCSVAFAAVQKISPN